MILCHPLIGLGKPIVKNAKPKKGTVAESRIADIRMTLKVTGKYMVNYRKKISP